MYERCKKDFFFRVLSFFFCFFSTLPSLSLSLLFSSHFLFSALFILFVIITSYSSLGTKVPREPDEKKSQIIQVLLVAS